MLADGRKRCGEPFAVMLFVGVPALILLALACLAL